MRWSLWRPLTLRILAAAVLSAALSGVLFTGMLIPNISGAVFTNALRVLYPDDGAHLDACEADPAGWSVQTADYAVFAYSADLSSANPDAPPFDAHLITRMRLGLPGLIRFMPDGEAWGGVLARQTDRDGPCAMLQFYWTPHPDSRAVIQRNFAALSLIVPLLSVVLALLLAIRPLVQRIQRLVDAAATMGGTYRSAEDGTRDALGQLSGALDEAEARQRQAREDLERHLDDIAHDLRTPLTALHLRLEAAADTPGPLQETLNAGLADVVYLTMLTENLRAAAHLRDGHTPSSRQAKVDLTALLSRVGDRFALLGQRRGVEVICAVPDDPVWVACPPVLAEQAFANLVHNAIVHNHAGGHVAITLEQPGSGFVVRVIDDGPGADLSEFPRLMARTARTDDARQRNPHGSGLGLAIAGEVFRRSTFTAAFFQEAPTGLRIEIRGERVPPPQVLHD